MFDFIRNAPSSLKEYFQHKSKHHFHTKIMKYEFIFKKIGHSRPFFLFHYSWQKTFYVNFCQCLDLNSGPLESEATTLPTEPKYVYFRHGLAYKNTSQLKNTHVTKFCNKFIRKKIFFWNNLPRDQSEAGTNKTHSNLLRCFGADGWHPIFTWFLNTYCTGAFV